MPDPYHTQRHQSRARAGTFHFPAVLPTQTGEKPMSDPPTKKAQTVNSLISLIRNVQTTVNPNTDKMLAEAFMQNFYAWLLEKASENQPTHQKEP